MTIRSRFQWSEDRREALRQAARGKGGRDASQVKRDFDREKANEDRQRRNRDFP